MTQEIEPDPTPQPASDRSEPVIPQALTAAELDDIAAEFDALFEKNGGVLIY